MYNSENRLKLSETVDDALLMRPVGVGVPFRELAGLDTDAAGTPVSSNHLDYQSLVASSFAMRGSPKAQPSKKVPSYAEQGPFWFMSRGGGGGLQVPEKRPSRAAQIEDAKQH